MELSKLVKKINNLDLTAYNTIYKILKNNNENLEKTNKFYLVDLNNVSEKTIKELINYVDYLDNINFSIENELE